MRPFTVYVPLSANGQLVVFELLAPAYVPASEAVRPSHAKLYLKPAAVSVELGSNAPVRARLEELPSVIGLEAVNVAVGATLATVTVKVLVLLPASLSVTVIVTV